MVSCTSCVRLREREMEAIVLGQKLQLQAEELAQLQLKQQNNDPTATELLQQAQADLVFNYLCLCVHLCVSCIYILCACHFVVF